MPFHIPGSQMNGPPPHTHLHAVPASFPQLLSWAGHIRRAVCALRACVCVCVVRACVCVWKERGRRSVHGSDENRSRWLTYQHVYRCVCLWRHWCDMPTGHHLLPRTLSTVKDLEHNIAVTLKVSLFDKFLNLNHT